MTKIDISSKRTSSLRFLVRIVYGKNHFLWDVCFDSLEIAPFLHLVFVDAVSRRLLTFIFSLLAMDFELCNSDQYIFACCSFQVVSLGISELVLLCHAHLK